MSTKQIDEHNLNKHPAAPQQHPFKLFSQFNRASGTIFGKVRNLALQRQISCRFQIPEKYITGWLFVQLIYQKMVGRLRLKIKRRQRWKTRLFLLLWSTSLRFVKREIETYKVSDSTFGNVIWLSKIGLSCATGDM